MNSILPFYKKNIRLLFYFCFLFFGINYGWSQTTTVFSESFDRGSVVQPITNGGTPTMTYTTATTATGSPSATGATSRTNLISGTDYALQILPGNSSATPTAQTAGQTYVTGALSSYSSPFGATLSSSPGPITWTFNMKTNRTTALSGFAASGYASAVVLAATSSTLHTVGNGYAVIEIKGTTTNTFKLIKYTNGLGGTQTVIAAPASDFLASNSSWASIRVVYTPSTNNWQLFLRDDTTAPVSPLTGVTTQAGSTVSDNTYTTSASSIFGFYFSHSAIGTPTSNTALFDNFNVSVTSLGPTITGATTTAAFTTTYGTPSAAQTFTVGGNNLGANLVATAPTGFEVATDGATYGATATFTSSGGTLSIRLKATASAGSYNSQNIVLSSTGATSVNITTPSTGNTLSAKALTITGLTGTNKSYDGTTTATFTGTPSYSGLVNSESYSVSGTASASFANAAVGTVKAITVSGYTAPTSNYTLTQPSLSANITAVPLTITGLTGNNKVYDGTTSATLSGTPSYSGLVNGETPSVTGTATALFDNASVGTGKTINVSGYTAPSNYTIIQPTLTANITQKTLTISGISVGNKVYDGSVSATISGTPTLVGVLNSETVTLDASAASASFASSEVGTGIAVTVSGYTISGTASSNYSLSQPTGLIANITSSATPVISSTLIASSTYGDSFSYQITASNDPTSFNATGFPSGLSIDTVTGILSGTPTVVGTYTISITAANGGGTSSVASLVFTIAPKTVTLTPGSATSKVYDRTTTATVSGASFSGVVSPDSVSVVATGTFASKNVGTEITVAISYSLNGTDASKYVLDSSSSSTTADITSAPLTVSGATASNKVYDGTNSAAVSGSTLVGVYSGDTVSISNSGTFESINVGNGIAVTSTAILSGTDASNYSLTQPSGLAANITAASLTISGIAIANKTYDGTTAATITGTPVLSGIIGTDDVTLVASGATATFSAATVATNVSVAVSGYTLTGAAASNYTVTQPTGLKANITAVTKYFFVPAATPNLSDATQWFSVANGTGVSPTVFTVAGITYQINVNATTTTAWTVSGTGSKIVVGDGTNTPNVTIGSGFAITGTIDVSAGATLTCGAATLPTFGALASTSTLNVTSSSALTLPSGNTTLGNLILSNGAVLTVGSSTSGRQLNVNGNFDVSGGTFSTTASVSTFILNFAGTSNTIKSSSASTYDKVSTISIASGANYSLLSDLKCNSGATVRIFSLSGNLNISDYTLDLAINTYTLVAGGVLTQNATSTIKTSNVSATPLPSGATWDGTVEYYSTSAQPVVAGSYRNLTITGASVKTPTSGTLTVAKNLIINTGSTYTGSTNNPTLNVGGNFTNSGTFTQGTGTLTLNGETSQTITNTGSFTNVSVNNAAGLVAATNLTISGALTLTSGVITTNSFEVIANGSVSRTSGHIAGNLRKPISTTTTAITYEIGGANLYRPIEFSFNGISVAGTLTASVSQTAGAHPQLGSSLVSATKRLDRYYSISNSGVNFSSCNVTFNFDASDVINGADTSSFIVNRYASSSWTALTTGVLTSTSTQVTGLTSFGDFALGETRTDPLLSVSAPIFFANQCINTLSTTKTFTILGQYLTSDPITVGPLTGYSFSLNGTSFTDSISLTQSGGTLVATTVYVQFTPTTTSSYAGSIAVSGGGAASVAISVTSANGINSPVVSATGSSSGVGANIATLSGSYTVGCSSIVDYGIEYSSTNNFTNGLGTKVSGSGGAAFTASLTGLSTNTTYYYKSYATDGTGTFYGTQSSFKTANIDAPTATAATNVTATSFTANWNSVAGATGFSLDVSLFNNFSAPSENFENALTLFTNSLGEYYSSNSASGDRPASSPLATSGTYGFGVTSGSAVITSNSLNTSSLTAPQLSFKLAAFSVGSTSNGVDATDIVTVEVSPDGGATYYSTVRVLGFSNAYWAYAATGVASTVYDGNVTPIDFQPAATGSRTTDGYSTVTVTGLPATSNLKIRITMLNNTANERWVIDNLSVTSTNGYLLPSYNGLSVSGTSQSVTGLSASTPYYYRVRAIDANSTSSNSNIISVTTKADPSFADYRSKTSGDFSDLATWEYNDGTSWVSAVQAPSSTNNVTILATHEVKLTADITVGSGKTLTVNGVLNAAGKVVSGSGSFALTSGSTIKLGDNVSLATAVTTTTKTFDGAANYVYNGTVAQTTASLPGTVTGNITIDNAAGVNMSASKIINTPGSLIVTSNGNLSFGTGIGSAATNVSGTGNLTTSTGSTLVITSSVGINSDGTGSIRLIGTRTFATGVNYNFTKNDTTTSLSSNMGTSFGSEITNINNLTVNNPYNVIVPINITVNGVLSIQSGNIVTGSNTITIAENGSVSRVGSGYVVGNLAKNITTATTAISYEIGDASNYRPIDLNFTGVSVAGTLSANVSQSAGSHPQLASSSINPTKLVNRYYSLNGTSLSFTSCDATFNYVASDVLNSATTSSFIIGQYNGASWSYPSVGTLSSTSSQAIGLTSFGDFAFGEAKPLMVSAVLSGTASVCTGSSTNLLVTVTGGTSPYTVVYNDGTSDITVNGYTSGTNIPVSPSSTKTYSLVSVSDTYTYTSPSNSGTAAVTVNQFYSFYADTDADGYGAGSQVSLCAVSANTPPVGYVINNTDCDDSDATKNASFPFYADTDADGYGAGIAVSLCAASASTPPAGYVTNNTDCDDSDATKNASFPFYADVDADGYGAGSVVSLCAVNATTPPTGYSLNGSDCNDSNNAIYQSASLYIDIDADGYDNGQATVCYGATIPVGYAATTSGTDCNDSDATKNASFPFYADTDGDGYGAGSLVSVCAVNATTPPAGYSLNNTDCDDSDAAKNTSFPFYVDTDADGYGAGSEVSLCAVNATTPPAGYSVNNTDCNDNAYSLTNTCSSIVNLKLNIQGYYDTATHAMRPVMANQGSGSSTTDVDDVTVELRDSTTNALVVSTTARLKTDGTATATFGTAPSGSFYIAVKHRNTLETWSSAPQAVGSTPLTYDFTTAANKAYGDNMIQLESGVYGFYSGDLNQDEAVDIFDFPLLLNDNDNFSSGYLSTDLNGDGAVDIFDFPLLLNNNDNFIYSSHP